MYPGAVGALNDSLCAKYHTVLVAIGEAIEDSGYLVLGEFLRGFSAEACEYLVCVVVMSVTAAAAGAFLTVVVVVMLVVVVIVAMALVVVVMIVTVAFLVVMVVVAMALIVVMVVVAMALIVVVMIVTVALVVVVIVAMALIVVMVIVAMALIVVVVVAMALIVVVVVVAMALIVVVMVMMRMLLLKALDSAIKSIAALHCREDSLTVKRLPRGYNDSSRGVMLTKKVDRLLYLGISCIRGAGEDDTGSVLYLVVIKLAKVAHIHLALIYVCDGGKCVKGSAVILCRSCRLYDVGKLTDARGLDNNSVG